MDNKCYNNFMEDLRPLVEALCACNRVEEPMHTASGQLKREPEETPDFKECMAGKLAGSHPGSRWQAQRNFEEAAKQCRIPKTLKEAVVGEDIFELYNTYQSAGLADAAAELINKTGVETARKQFGNTFALYRRVKGGRRIK